KPLNMYLPGKSALVYSTFLGGTNGDKANGIAVDSEGNAYVTGSTTSTNFPIVFSSLINTNPAGLSSFLTTNGNALSGVSNVFLTKISSDGSQIMNSIVFGGSGMDVGYGVAVDPVGDAFVVGAASSTNFPTVNTFNTLNYTNSGGRDVFVTGIKADWTATWYSVLIGGKKRDEGYGIALDSATNVFITGSTTSTNFPTANSGRFFVTFTNTFNVTNITFETNDMDGTNIIITTNVVVMPTNVVVATNYINGTNFIDGNKFVGTNDAFLSEILFTTPSPMDITLVPTSQTLGVGDTARFTLTVSGISTPVLYQWQRFDKLRTNVVTGISTNIVAVYTNLPNTGRFRGATSNVLTITNVIPADSSSNYQAVITWGEEPYITNATLDVEQGPIIDVPPADQTNFFGGTAVFAVTAFGQPPLHYQWQFNGTNLVNSGGHVSGATNNVLIITGLTTNNAGTFDVVITNAFGTNFASATLAINVTSPTNITLVPTNEVVGLGGTARFTLTVAGTSTPVFYQWQRETFANGVPTGIYTNLLNSSRVSGATSNVLTIASVTTADGNGSPSNYQAVINWGEGPYITNATLDVEQSPVIAVPPADQTNFFRGTATFSVIAFGQTPLHYQWLFDGTNLVNSSGQVSGATNSTLTITGLTTNNEGSYEVVITNVFGSASAAATLTLDTTSPTNITLVPTNDIVGVGGTARFTLTVTGTSTPVFYQWQREIFTNVITTNIIVGVSTNQVTNSVPSGVYTNLLNSGRFSGVTSNILTITNVMTVDSSEGSNYQAIINWGDVPYITNATLDVEQGPVIAVPPADQTNAFGTSATFTVTVFGQPPLYYQWSFDGTNLVNSSGQISGATNSTLTITGLNTNNEGSYEVVITNSFGMTNASATLTLITAPLIEIPLTNELAGLGTTVPFAVTVVGETPLHYSWQKDGVPLVNSTNIIGSFTNIISGANSNILTLTGANTNNDGTYEVTVTNDFGATNSSGTLTVLTAPLFTGLSLISNSIFNGLQFSGSGVSNNLDYAVFSLTNLQEPSSNWFNLGKLAPDSQGNFSFTFEPVLFYGSNLPQEFFILQQTNR
ncbi:MAG TPA: immunoglobulin domain-containing protein, partial [Pseudomonadales bacterium]|nr:immunoglobulin domain-containing protein [Pseudomonadales bacterium]